MKKVIAILTQKGALSSDIHYNTKVNIFKLEDEKVIEYESLKLDNNEYVHFSLLMKLKKVNLLYANTINNELKNMLKKSGIITKCKNEFTNDQFMEQFIFE